MSPDYAGFSVQSVQYTAVVPWVGFVVVVWISVMHSTNASPWIPVLLLSREHNGHKMTTISISSKGGVCVGGVGDSVCVLGGGGRGGGDQLLTQSVADETLTEPVLLIYAPEQLNKNAT